MKHNIKRILGVALMLISSVSAWSQIEGVEPLAENDDVIAGVDMKHWNFDVRLGFSIGGTMPMDFPVEMRGINSFSPKFNYRFGFDIEYRFNKHWGMQSGLYLERKGFKGDMRVRQYEMSVNQGDETLHGVFTGNVMTNIVQTGFTLPLQANWWVNRKCKIKFGPYVSLLTDRTFSGYAYDGYLRDGNSKGKLTEMGSDADSRGEFSGEDFDKGLRQWLYGLDAGVDWYFSRHWGMFADVSWGLNAAFKSDFETITMALYPVYGTIGVVYKIGR